MEGIIAMVIVGKQICLQASLQRGEGRHRASVAAM